MTTDQHRERTIFEFMGHKKGTSNTDVLYAKLPPETVASPWAGVMEDDDP
jgi:hypothetical protein